MTDRLQEIRARLDAATPGPFEWHGCPPGDAAFLAHAPDDLRWLLAKVESLREANSELAATIAEMQIAEAHRD